jgi:spore coat protein U-like protein
MSRPATHIASVLAAGALGLLWLPGVTWAEAANDSAGVQCVLQSASLNFGRLNLQRAPLVAGEGEVRVACQNTAPEVRRVMLSMAFSTPGPQTAVLQSGRSALAVAFYQDAQHAVRWGDEQNGAGALHIGLELGPGERKQLQLPVYALLHSPRDAAAGVYLTHVPLTLTTLPR